LPNKVTMTHLLKLAEEPVVFTAWKRSEHKRAETETTVKYNTKFRKTAVIFTEFRRYCNMFALWEVLTSVFLY
jgi:desulfoferrodoxin (superoxide reductase-like protein)